MAHVATGNAKDNLGGVWQDKTQVYALAGNDTIISDNKSDFLIVGGSGDDSLVMYGGKGSLSGGAGKDTFDLTYSADRKLSAVIEDLDPANDKIVVNFDGSAAPQLTSSVKGNDVIWRDSDGFLNVTLKGVRENDYFDGTASNEIWEVLDITNNEREAKNLPWLTMSADLMQGASVRAQEITALGLSGILTDHTRPNGEDFSTVLEKEYVSPPHENLEAGAASAAEVMENWMDSTTHRENILNSDFNKLGVGYNYQDDGDPTHHRYYWTQLFADSLKSPETVSTADLLTANMEVNTVKKFVTLTENPDTYSNTEYSATIAALGGADSITNTKPYVSISGGADSDTIDNRGNFATICAGTGDDVISLSGDAQGNYLEYALGDGNDTVYGFNVDNALVFLDSEFTPVTLGNDIIISVGADSITLVDAEDFYYFGTRSKLIIRTEKDDEWENTLDDATIQALAGNDYVVNSGKNVIVDGDDDNDYIYNWSETVSISGGNGNDTVWNLGKDSTIDAGAGTDYISNEGDRVSIVVGTDNDSIYNYGSDVTIDTGDGINYIDNRGKNVIINGGADRDSLLSTGDFVTLNGNAGDDHFVNHGSNVKMYGGDGNEWLGNQGDSVTMDGGAGNDAIGNWGSSVTMEGGDGDDNIGNNADSALNVSISGGAGNDSISNFGSNHSLVGEEGNYSVSIGNHNFVTLDGGTGNDTIDNTFVGSVTISGGDGNDSIRNGYGDSVSVAGGAGNDTIYSSGTAASLNGGADNDRIVLGNVAQNNLIQYKPGDGRDTVYGFNETDTLQIMGGTGFYSTLESDEDIFVYVGTGSILLRNAAGLSAVNISGRRREFREETAVVTLTEDPDTYSNTVEGMTILALGGADSITNSGANVSIDGGADDDYINTAGNNVTVEVGDGSDSIFNDGDLASLNGGEDKDFIANSGANVSMDGGKGDDFISLSSDSENNLIIYNEGDGNDTISGFKNTDFLGIFNQKFTRSTVGNDVVVKVGNSPGSVTLLDGATLTPPYIHIWDTLASNLITLFETNNQFSNDIDDATIVAFGGDDTLENYGKNVSIRGGDGDDFITNRGENSTLDGNAGNDSISNYSNNVTINGGDGDDDLDNYNNNNGLINGGAGNDSIYNSGVNVTIDAGAGNDYIYNSEGSEVTIDSGAGDDTIVNRSNGTNVTIDLGAGDDSIWNYADNVTIFGSAGNDSIINDGASVTIDAGAGNDTVWNRGADVSILGGADDDTVANYGSNVTIDGGDGNDYVENAVEGENVIINGGNGNDNLWNLGKNVTINAGKGNDNIGMRDEARNNVIQYNLGDGDDTLWGYSTNTTLNISEENVTSVASGDNMIIYVGDGSITLIDAREKLPHIVLGAGGTSGGGSGSGGGGGGSGSGGGSSSGSGGSGSGGSSGGSGGSSGGSSGSSGGSGTSGTSSGKGSSSGGSRIRTAAHSSRVSFAAESQNVSATVNQVAPDYISQQQIPSNTKYSSAATSTGEVILPNLDFSSATTQQIVSQRVYSGGNQIISDYQSGQKIVFAEVYTGAFYDAANNFCVGSSTGALVIQNATDKVVDLTDAAGNDFLKAYTASTAGVIDGRGLAGFELINGSAGADAIFAGDDGSQLWGGADMASDTLVGGNGTDIFIGGRTQGADVFFNASSADIVHLNDATLSDIVATEENNGAIAIAFNTGNVVAVQSSEALSATFMLAGGSVYRYNHATRNWQSATN